MLLALLRQATEVIKILLGKGDVLSGRLLVYDALKMSFKVCMHAACMYVCMFACIWMYKQVLGHA